MPHADDLPKDLRPLAVHQAMDLRDAHFHSDADLLIDVNDKSYEDKHFYTGTVEGDTIRFTLMTDSAAESHVPVHFTATRAGAR